MMRDKRFSKPVFLFFILVSFLDVVGIFIQNPLLQTVCKPMIIPSLMAWYLIKTDAINKWYVIALFFSFVGDVLLLDKINLFIFGIAAFLITQVIYIFIFSKGLAKVSRQKKLTSILPFLLFYSALISILSPNLNDLLIPVMVYGMAISIFGTIALLNYLAVKNKLSMTLLQGALLFILSDSMIALNKFHEEQSFYPVTIMLTYIVAQYLIASYMLGSESKVLDKD
jgi:uncharacterized membrane protein YhhN